MLKNKKIKNTTIDDLAIMITKGFEEMATKSDLLELEKEMKEGFIKVHDDITYIHGNLDAIEREITDIKKKLDNIVYRHEFETLRDRIASLEKKLGLKI